MAHITLTHTINRTIYITDRRVIGSDDIEYNLCGYYKDDVSWAIHIIDRFGDCVARTFAYNDDECPCMTAGLTCEICPYLNIYGLPQSPYRQTSCTESLLYLREVSPYKERIGNIKKLIRERYKKEIPCHI